MWKDKKKMVQDKKRKLEDLWIENSKNAKEKDLLKSKLNKKGEDMTKKFKDLSNSLKKYHTLFLKNSTLYRQEAEYRKERRKREQV